LATNPDTIEEILSNAGDTLELTARKMFGEYGIYLEGKMVALVCEDTLFVKALPVVDELLGPHEQRPPYVGAKPHSVVPKAFMAQEGRLAGLLRGIWKVLPDPKPKTPRAPKGRAARRA